MVWKLVCDVCGAEIPKIEHDEAANEYSGSFMYHSGTHDAKDLCGSCARRVKQFIDDMK